MRETSQPILLQPGLSFLLSILFAVRAHVVKSCFVPPPAVGVGNNGKRRFSGENFVDSGEIFTRILSRSIRPPEFGGKRARPPRGRFV